MKQLLVAPGLALILMAMVSLNVATTLAQDAGTPGPPATTRPVIIEPVRVADDENIERAPVVDKADEPRSWSWLGWPTTVGSMMLGGFWVYRRFQTSLLKARLAKLPSGGEQRPLDASPLVQSYLGGLPSGALLLLLTTSMSFGINALYNYPSQIASLHPWIDVVPWAWYLGGAFVIGLLSESRGGGVILILGYASGITLWHFTPGQSVNALFYDIGWLGFLLGPVGMTGLIFYLIFRLGRAFRRPFS